MKIIRLTTVATTGRLIKRSVKLISSSWPSAVCGGRRQIAARLDLVIDTHMCSALQSEHARSDDLIACLQSRCDGNHVATRLACFDKLLLYPLVLFSLRILHLRNDKDGIAVGRIMNRGGGDPHHVLFVAHDDTHLGKHPRTEAKVR